MLNVTIRRKAKQFGSLVRTSAITPRTGRPQKPQLVSESELGVTFIGHSSFLVQIGGLNLAIDPNFARWLFVLKRQRRPGVRLRDLPPIDYVLVTHAHFDHLHRPSLRAIARLSRWHSGRSPEVIVPRNVGDVVARLGFGRVHEMEWWQEFSAGRLSITHTPAQHWGARMLRDFHRGFGGYVVRTPQHSLYHAGDTAYFEGFHEIGRRLRPEIALMPIGAYHPEHFRNVHTSPEDALEGFLDLGSRCMIPMHYGTFRLSYEPMDEPVKRLRLAASAAGVSEQILVLEEGTTKIFR